MGLDHRMEQKSGALEWSVNEAARIRGLINQLADKDDSRNIRLQNPWETLKHEPELTRSSHGDVEPQSRRVRFAERLQESPRGQRTAGDVSPVPNYGCITTSQIAALRSEVETTIASNTTVRSRQVLTLQSPGIQGQLYHR